jgi:hypothetical protein
VGQYASMMDQGSSSILVLPAIVKEMQVMNRSSNMKNSVTFLHNQATILLMFHLYNAPLILMKNRVSILFKPNMLNDFGIQKQQYSNMHTPATI